MSGAEKIAVITSAAYVDSELSAEYGHMPPSLLPFGHHRLFQRQVELLKKVASRIILTLPESFKLNSWEADWLTKNAVEVLAIPDGLSLGESISYALTVAGATGQIYILHGDTMFTKDLPSAPDSIGVAQAPSVYDWGRMGEADATEDGLILSGWFSFSSATNLIRCITIKRGQFIAALDLYAETLPLTPVTMSGWLDFGHLQTFYRARTQISIARSFNALNMSRRTVFKTGEKIEKLHAEADWFSSIPPMMRLYTPAFLGKEDTGYWIGYEFNPTLHELFVFGTLKPAAWERIMAGAFDFLTACRSSSNEALAAQQGDVIGKLATGKTTQRLEKWARESGTKLYQEWKLNGRQLPSLTRIVAETGELIASTTPLPGVMHGDFCFPNVFFDFRQETVKVIDPRGGVEDKVNSIYGDVRYDLAKLNHSIQGYDLILAGRYHHSAKSGYDVEFDIPKYGASEFVEYIAREHAIEGQSTASKGILALTIHLFLSMLPLHADRPDRQKAFLANALRLYGKLEQAQ